MNAGALTWKLCPDNGIIINIDGTEKLVADYSDESTIAKNYSRPVTNVISCHGDAKIAPAIMAMGVSICRDTRAFLDFFQSFYNFVRLTAIRLNLGSIFVPYFSIDYSIVELQALNLTLNGCTVKTYLNWTHDVCLGNKSKNWFIENEKARFVICKFHVSKDPKQHILSLRLPNTETKILISLTLSLLEFIVKSEDWNKTVSQIQLFILLLNKKYFTFSKEIFSINSNCVKMSGENEIKYDVNAAIEQKWSDMELSASSSTLPDKETKESEVKEENLPPNPSTTYFETVTLQNDVECTVENQDYQLRIFFFPFGDDSSSTFLTFDVVSKTKLICSVPKLGCSFVMELKESADGLFFASNTAYSPDLSKYFATTYASISPMLSKCVLGEVQNLTNNIAELVNKILKHNYSSLLEPLQRLELALEIFAIIIDNELQRFWLQHDKQYGKSVVKQIKETIRDCTSKGKLTNMERESTQSILISPPPYFFFPPPPLPCKNNYIAN